MAHAEKDIDMTLKELGEFAAKLRDGAAQLIEDGFDPEELDAQIAEAEAAHREREAERRQRIKTRRAVSRF